MEAINNNSSDILLNISYILKKEFFRKTIHMTSAFVPFFYYFNQTLVITVLLSVTLLYFFSEFFRLNNINLPVISNITVIASRPKDTDKVILGPITLSLGVFLALVFFDYRVAVISIFSLAFGDGVASLFGKIIGGYKIPMTFGKTFSGSIGCFIVLTVVFIACGLTKTQAVMLAFIAAIIEVFPTGDFDNILIPVITGILATKIL
jgi:dolichol kinase